MHPVLIVRSGSYIASILRAGLCRFVWVFEGVLLRPSQNDFRRRHLYKDDVNSQFRSSRDLVVAAPNFRR